MALPHTSDVALKEWHIVCRALESGRQIILLRKGGIYESAGEFEVERRRFFLFPTYVHQRRDMLKSEVHGQFEPRAGEPEQIELRAWGEVSDIVEVKSRAQMEALDAEHIWAPPLIEMRFSYRPENPLYLLVVRAHVLSEPVMLENTPAYAGCKSWVPLGREIDVTASRPVLGDAAYQARRARIIDLLKC